MPKSKESKVTAQPESTEVLGKRSQRKMLKAADPGDLNVDDISEVEKDGYKKLHQDEAYVLAAGQPGKGHNTAVHLRLGDTPREVGLKNLMGCTSMFLVSPTAVYATHWFEDTNFGGKEGDDIADGIIVTSYKHPQEDEGSEYEIDPLQDGQEIVTNELEVRYLDEIKDIKDKVQEILGHEVTWLSAEENGSTFGGFIAPLQPEDLVGAAEKLVGTAMFSYTSQGTKKANGATRTAAREPVLEHIEHQDAWIYCTLF